jgi:hypothetical protein
LVPLESLRRCESTKSARVSSSKVREIGRETRELETHRRDSTDTLFLLFPFSCVLSLLLFFIFLSLSSLTVSLLAVRRIKLADGRSVWFNWADPEAQKFYTKFGMHATRSKEENSRDRYNKRRRYALIETETQQREIEKEKRQGGSLLPSFLFQTL